MPISPPRFTCDFAAAESLIIESARAWRVHNGLNYLFERRLTVALGPDDAEQLARPLHGLMTGLMINARRPLVFLRPGDPSVSADERALIGVLAAVAHGHGDAVAARLAWLVERRVYGAIAVTLERVANVLARHGFTFADLSPRRGSGFALETSAGPAANVLGVTSRRRPG